MVGLFLLVSLAAAGVKGVPGTYLDFLNNGEEDIDSKEDGLHAGAVGTNCTCGQTNKARVVGGRETQKNEFPLMAGLYAPDQKLMFCGAAIITVWHALTAAHCTVPFGGSKLALLIGEHDITKIGETNAELIPIERVFEHRRYNMDTMENDIAFIQLQFPMKYNQIVGPACLPTKPQDFEGEFVKVLGWGLTTDGGVQSAKLQKANLRVISLQECAKVHPQLNTARPAQLCTWMKNRDSCDGDSGGPLLWLDPKTNRFQLAGLVSFGAVCASNAPAVYTDVASFLPWIQFRISASRKNVQTCARLEG